MKGVIQGALPRAFQGLVHGVSSFLGRKAGLLREFWQEGAAAPLLGAK
jgi:hypothetical protein